jgi:hypothetical protein
LANICNDDNKFLWKIKNLWRTKTLMIFFLHKVMGPENLFSSTWSGTRRAAIIDLKVIKRTLSLANI